MINFINLIKNKSFRISFLQGYESYWNILNTLAKLRFRVIRMQFSLKQKYKDSLQSASILWVFIKEAAWGVVFAILLVITLSVIEQYIPTGRLPSLMVDPVDVYGVLAQISGLILGLYFTAMIVVVSTIYSKVPGNIRNLIAREKAGDKYINILMSLGATSLVELGAILQGKPPSLMVLYVTLFMSLLVILVLRKLIHNIFYFFDPARLVEAYVFPEIADWAEKATCEYQGWDNISFQEHYRKQANQGLSTHRNIIDLLIRDPNPNNASLARLLIIELSFFSYYTKIKNQIPTNSRWYQRQAEHPRWFETNSSLVGSAMDADVFLPPEEAPNRLWVEERVANNLKVVLSHLLEEKDLEHAIELIQNLHMNCTGVVKILALKESYFLTGICDEVIINYLSKAVLDDRNKMHHLVLADLYGASHVNIPIEYGKALGKISSDSLRKKLQSINWENSVSVYAARLPVSILPTIEDMLQKKKNQFMVDSSIKVPAWYDMELASIACLKSLHETVEEVVSQYEKAFTGKIEGINREGITFLSMQILVRGLEGHNKCSTFLLMAKNLDRDLHDMIVVKDIPHSTLEWSEYEKRIEEVRFKVIERLGTLAIDINPEDIDKSIPDYVGHAYWLLARECFLALCRQDEERYKKFYKIYMILMNKIWEYFRSILDRGTDTEYYMSVFSEIFVDVMAIGGYAKLFNEFIEGSYWKSTKDIWDTYLELLEGNEKDILATFVGMVKYKNQSSLSGITNRNLERRNWEQKYNYIVESETGLSNDYFHYGEGRFRGARDQAESALLRAFGTSDMCHAESIFIYSYILQKPEMENVEVDWQTKQFIESLNIILMNNQNADDA